MALPSARLLSHALPAGFAGADLPFGLLLGYGGDSVHLNPDSPLLSHLPEWDVRAVSR